MWWRPVLTAELRGDLNAQGPHLARRRKAGYPWDLGGLMIKACEVFVAFVEQLREADPARAAWFEDAYRRAAVVVTTQRAQFQGQPITTTSPSYPVAVTHSFGRGDDPVG